MAENPLKQTIEDAAKQPQLAAVRGMRVRHHSLKDLVQAAYYLDGLTAQELLQIPAPAGTPQRIAGMNAAQAVPGPILRVI